MNAEEYEAYRKSWPSEPTISMDQMSIVRGTLAYGYTVDRYDWHAYVHHGEIHLLVLDNADRILFHAHGQQMPAARMRPDERVYPDTVNVRFAELMRDAGEPLPFLGNFDFDGEHVARRAARGVYAAKIHTEV